MKSLTIFSIYFFLGKDKTEAPTSNLGIVDMVARRVPVDPSPIRAATNALASAPSVPKAKTPEPPNVLIRPPKMTVSNISPIKPIAGAALPSPKVPQINTPEPNLDIGLVVNRDPVFGIPLSPRKVFAQPEAAATVVPAPPVVPQVKTPEAIREDNTNEIVRKLLKYNLCKNGDMYKITGVL